MEAKMQMIDYYLTKYDFMISRKVSVHDKCNVAINIGCKLLKPEEHGEKIWAGVELHADITINSEENKTEVGKIAAVIRGIFNFDKSISTEEMQNLLKINGAAIVYQQLRAYINANTALSNSVPNIVLPVLNFSEVKSNKEDKENN